MSRWNIIKYTNKEKYKTESKRTKKKTNNLNDERVHDFTWLTKHSYSYLQTKITLKNNNPVIHKFLKIYNL